MSLSATHLPLDIWDEAVLIEASLGEFLKPAKPGWYLQNNPLPVMVAGQKYFEKINGQLVEITDVRKLRSTIYDAHGNIVFSYPPHGRVMFFDHPMVPTIGLYIIKEYVEAVLNNNLRWVPNKVSFAERLKKYFRPLEEQPDIVLQVDANDRETLIGIHDGTSVESLKTRFGAGIEISRTEKIFHYCEEEIRSILMSVRDALAAFMGADDHWRIYECELKHRTLMVKRLGDYRIWDYERIQQVLKGEDVYVRRINDKGDDEYVSVNLRLGL